MRRRSSAKVRCGFTILELLVAMVITAILLVMLSSVVSYALKNFRQIDETVRLQSDASAALSVIAADLQAAAVEIRPFEVLESQPQTNDGLPFSWLMGLSRTYDNPGSNSQFLHGELRSFSYKVAYADPISGTGGSNGSSYILYRTTLPVGTTLSNVLIPMMAQPTNGLVANYWTNHPSTAPDDYLVGNVARFDVAWTYETRTANSTNVVRQTVPANTAMRYRQDYLTMGSQGTNAKLVKAMITLTLLPESVVKQLRSRGIKATTNDIAVKGHSFSREVSFGLP